VLHSPQFRTRDAQSQSPALCGQCRSVAGPANSSSSSSSSNSRTYHRPLGAPRVTLPCIDCYLFSLLLLRCLSRLRVRVDLVMSHAYNTTHSVSEIKCTMRSFRTAATTDLPPERCVMILVKLASTLACEIQATRATDVTVMGDETYMKGASNVDHSPSENSSEARTSWIRLYSSGVSTCLPCSTHCTMRARWWCQQIMRVP